MTNNQLQQLVEEVSLRYFAKPFCHHARFNSRLRSTGGRYYLQSHDIDINPRMLNDFSIVNLINVIKHELCHYHLHLAGYSGRHNTPEFKQLLRAVGGSRYAPQPKHVRWLKYRCLKCGRIYWRHRHLDTHRYVCSYCYGPLKLES
ncbi:SprT family protein [Acetilactobacillus jinshanensis]|uniref:SprT family protein n=1 Tax=Acetilactobacillus jinshanensis TaxID=1720083 RepID=A0A4P6ZJC7_9LACO|nr:SprT family protein [Acetilactobacillus jinshanensis]QBP17728.1 SprT family protein [Acetilactobacillus jinshanensis]URL60589.1 SprT family protein [uncultured bacterium]